MTKRDSNSPDLPSPLSRCPWLSLKATPPPPLLQHTIQRLIHMQPPPMLPQPTFFNSHIHFNQNQGNTDSELVIPRSSTLFKRHIPAMSPWRETDSEGYMKRKSLDFLGIIGHLRDRHGQRLDSWTLCSQLANYWRTWFNVPTEGATFEPCEGNPNTKSQHQWHLTMHQLRSRKSHLMTINLLRFPTRSFRWPGSWMLCSMKIRTPMSSKFSRGQLGNFEIFAMTELIMHP